MLKSREGRHMPVVFAVAAVTIVPALWVLYILDQKSLLPQESVGADS